MRNGPVIGENEDVAAGTRLEVTSSGRVGSPGGVTSGRRWHRRTPDTLAGAFTIPMRPFFCLAASPLEDGANDTFRPSTVDCGVEREPRRRMREQRPHFRTEGPARQVRTEDGKH